MLEDSEYLCKIKLGVGGNSSKNIILLWKSHLLILFPDGVARNYIAHLQSGVCKFHLYEYIFK